MDAPLKVIVIEDHDALRDITVQALLGLGCQAIGVPCAEDVDELPGPSADLYIIDLNLPGEDGISLAKRIRQSHLHAGIIMVSSRHQLAEKMAAYEGGADFYLTKPTSMQELGAVIKVFGRRLKSDTFERKAGYTLDASALTLMGRRGNNDVVLLSVAEVNILSALSRAADCRLEFWQLMNLSHRTNAESGKNALEVQIVRLRKKLAALGAPSFAIKGLRGYGYQLCIPITVV
jgi:DNA-binding response OmpR family regulator